MSRQLVRIMRPDDANIAGNVHGGTILKMIEEAGAIISTRHCNSQAGEPCVAALARVERTDFLSPMCIGEVANVSAEITYTSRHSVEVQVNVMSENILTGAKKVTNKATLWYVPLSLKNVNKVVEVPPIQYARKEQEEEGKKRYEEQKLDRLETKQRNGDVIFPVINPEPHTVGYSQSSLIHLVGPSDCTLLGFVHGGVTMKLMDEVAGIVAARHCKTNIVTASVDAINFHEKIKKGSVITISGRMTFTSNKSMEIEVFVDADPFVDESRGRYRAVSAFFTYVSLSKEGKPLPVPQLLIAVRACFLGFAFGCGLLLSAGRSAWRHFGWYMCSLSLFHYSEYLVTAINNPRSLSLDSFLLNHSFEYNLAALSSWVEFTLEKLLFPELKQITWLSTVGLLMVIFGDCLRKAAMLTAGSNFNHIVQNEKSDTHTLVTSGVYGWFRHPSYVGWFYWSIGTQVLLCNPICVVGYALASWRFFRERIEEEEITLIHFFGEEYLEYKRKVPSGLPFIKGVKVEL
ncbi:cytosolic acyl coenzyme a thioester hydrolase [Limosa lapponica baueri]|uniref:Protein-S-isoprenylcysteine O-methyltransferase n=1 Tax=Limosa lapponica baueri TaxID=1758121 RepID=A0A2I0T8V4_LIMLA|nr:cytosolic acyl coenzyme a thioester hydrolase [Limosa lapponica baueri]